MKVVDHAYDPLPPGRLARHYLPVLMKFCVTLPFSYNC